MSFLSQIQQFQSASLKKTETKIQTCDGKTFVEKREESGEYSRTDAGEESVGWVVDLKPDLQMAEVRPGLFLGSQDVAADLELLQGGEITHILNLAPGVANKFPENFTYHTLPILDVPETDILQNFQETHGFIKSCLDEGGKILVHCNAGVSRAPTVVAAYLIRTEKRSASAALRDIKKKRPSVSPNNGFLEQLGTYEKYVSNRAPV